MARSYTIATVKTLFGEASVCAYPTCPAPLIFVDDKRGVRSVSAEIAHIRSGSSKGPRHVAGFTAVNEPANLLLLCPLHHAPVDKISSAYTIEELEEWKSEQIATGVAATLTDEEIESVAEKLDQLIDLLKAATTLDIACSIVAGLEVGGGVSVVPLSAANSMSIGWDRTVRLEPKYLGVQAANRGSLDCQVAVPGLELDVGDEHCISWMLVGEVLGPPVPHTLSSHSASEWLIAVTSLKATQAELLSRDRSKFVERFRAFVRLGSGQVFYSDWEHAVMLPSHPPSVSREQLDEAIQERAKRNAREQ